jgi:hypothetical protein
MGRMEKYTERNTYIQNETKQSDFKATEEPSAISVKALLSLGKK